MGLVMCPRYEIPRGPGEIREDRNGRSGQLCGGRCLSDWTKYQRHF